MMRAERVLEPCVSGAGIDQIRPAKLTNVSEALDYVGVDESEGELVDSDVVPDGAAQYLEAHTTVPAFRGWRQPFGPAFLIAASTLPNFSKFLRNISASFFACASYAAPSLQVRRGFNTSVGTSVTSDGIAKPNTGSSSVLTLSSAPPSAAATIFLVCDSFMRLPVPYAPPLQPVLISHTFDLCSWSKLPSISAYLVGCHTRNTAPKHALKVACGSVTPRSVPATLAVYPERK